MGSLLPVLVMTMLAVGLLLVLLLPADFRKILSRPANLGDWLLVRSLGLVAVVTLIWHFVGGRCSNSCSIYGCSPCLYFGIYASLVLYGRAGWYVWKRQTKNPAVPSDAA